MLIRPGYPNLRLAYDFLRSELDELLMSLRTVFQKVARDKVRYPEILTRQTVNDQMRLIYSVGRGAGGGVLEKVSRARQASKCRPLFLEGYAIELISRSKITVKFR